MATYSHTPAFNIKVVVAETGLKPDTIRAWERRYGLPEPQRSSGGHRLYSEHDIITLKWLLARKDEGLGISKAVRLWRQLEKEGQDPLQGFARRARRGPGVPAPLPSAKSLEEARQAWVQACLAFDEAAAERIMAEAFAAFPIEAVCTSVLQAGLSTIGELWHANRASVQQEHFASELAVRRIEALVAAAPPPHRAGRIMIGCVTDEFHTFAPLLLVLLLRRRGWEVVYLGANVPLARLEAAVGQVDPQLVVLTAQRIQSAARLQEMAFHLERVGVRVAYGGLIFNRLPALCSQIPGEFLGKRLEGAVDQLEQLLDSMPNVPRVPERDPTTQAALDHFRDQQSNLANQLWTALKDSGIRPADLHTANHFFGQGIVAALSLGDIAYLGEDLRWVGALLTNYGANHGSLSAYLQAYLQAARQTLGEQGAPVLAWLERVAADPSGGESPGGELAADESSAGG